MVVFLTLTSALSVIHCGTMTNEEKFTAIVERLKAKGWLENPQMISVMVIINYLDKLEELGMVSSAFNMSQKGKNIAAVCEEFDWKPSDEDIIRFCDEMVEDVDKVGFTFIVKQYRDDREKILDDIDRFKRGD